MSSEITTSTANMKPGGLVPVRLNLDDAFGLTPGDDEEADEAFVTRNEDGLIPYPIERELYTGPLLPGQELSDPPPLIPPTFKLPPLHPRPNPDPLPAATWEMIKRILDGRSPGKREPPHVAKQPTDS